MKLLIDIPEHIIASYKEILEHTDYSVFEVQRPLIECIVNGTPVEDNSYCEKCKYYDDETYECLFYSMGSGNEIDKPCNRRE